MSKAFITQYAIMKNNGQKPAAALPEDAMADEGAPTSIIDMILEKRRAAKMMAEGGEISDEIGKENYSEAEGSLDSQEPKALSRSESIRARIKALRK